MKPVNFIPALTVGGLFLAACASIGRPDGGPRDTEPPIPVRSNPAQGEKNVKSQKISIYFNENVQLDNPGNKIAISPAQTQQPSINANGKHISIELKDSLIPNTTYTIDFSDAISDLNEGNLLEGYTLAFSTGNEIDSLSISGMVLQADNLEPAQGMLVGVYLTDADSAITTRPFDRITRTNQLGQFSVRNLASGSYQLFAVNDLNRDFHWDRSEDIAFYGEPITPSAYVTQTFDSLRGSDGMDSIVSRQVVEFIPNDILLTWFNEEYKPQYLKNYNRADRRIISLEMNAPVDSLPSLTIIGMGAKSIRQPLSEVSILSHSANGDTLNYWLTDSTIIASDSLLIETKYRRVDSLDNIIWYTDSLKFNVKGRKGKQKEEIKVRTLQDKIDSILAISDTIPIDTFALMQPTTFLNITLQNSTQDINKPLYFSTERPFAKLDLAGIRLEMMPDSLWIPVEGIPQPMEADSTWRKNLMIDYKWTPGMKYRLQIDSLAVADPYGVYNRNLSLEFKVRNTDDYSNLIFNVTGLEDNSDNAYVEIITSADVPVTKAPVINGRADINFLLPGTYYARLFIDSNNDGKYTSGSFTEQRQPEEVYYFHKKMNLKKNWDRTETWNILEFAPDLQKPDDIKKNKPKPKPGEVPDRSTNNDDEEDDEDGFGQNYFSR